MRIAAILVAALLFAPAGAWACADGPDAYKVRNVAADDTLNVRSGPGLDYSVIAELPSDARGVQNLDRVPVHLCDGNFDSLSEFEKKNLWTKIRWEGGGSYIIGWVKTRFLMEDEPR